MECHYTVSSYKSSTCEARLDPSNNAAGAPSAGLVQSTIS
jgi:hypothetical protein